MMNRFANPGSTRRWLAFVLLLALPLVAWAGDEVPVIGVAPADLSASLESGDSTELPLTVSNSGSADLHWAFDLDADWSTISHGQSPEIVAGHTEVCSLDEGQTTAGNAYLRQYVLPAFGIMDAFQVSSIAFAVEELDSAQDVVVNLYTLQGQLEYDNLSLVATTGVSLEPQSQTLVEVPVSVTIPAMATLVLEIVPPNLDGTGRFLIGSNDAGETMPSFLAAPECGLPEPVPHAALVGHPNIHTVMSVTGHVAGAVACDLPGDVEWLTADPADGVVAIGASQEVTIGLDATGLEPGSHDANLCLSSNDPADPLVSVPVALTVTGGVPERPVIDIDPENLSSELMRGLHETQTLTIANVGAETLTWSVPDLSHFQTVIRSLAVWDDGTGPALYVGGNPTSDFNGIARWDGGEWSFLGTGMNGNVTALTVYQDELIAAGAFVQAGGETVNRIARWDGSGWSPLGTGMNGAVNALVVHAGDLIAAGAFVEAGGATVNRIARWDGSDWSPLGAGMNGAVNALAVHAGDLIAAGVFVEAGGATVNRIARWDGNDWLPLDQGFDGLVGSLAVFDGDLYAGGRFAQAGDLVVNRIARWDGAGWSALGTGIPGAVTTTVDTLIEFDGDLIAAGRFAEAGGVGVTNIARWDGSGWSALADGLDGQVLATTVFGDDLVAGGFFSNAGDVAARYVATWDGEGWSPLVTEPTACDLPDWLLVDPAGGSVPAGETRPVSVGFDATVLEPGDYATDLCILSNDVDALMTLVPVALTVTPAPQAEVEPAAFAFTVAQGEGATEVLDVGNAGPVDLEWAIGAIEHDLVVFDDIDYTVPADQFGGTVRWDTGDTCDACQNPPYNFNMWQTASDGNLSFYWPGESAAGGGGLSLDGSTYALLEPGATVGPHSDFIRLTATAATIEWRRATNADGQLGFRFVNPDTGVENYGYAHITTTGISGHPATVVGWVYDQAGQPVAVGGCSHPADIPWLSVEPLDGVTEPDGSAPVDFSVATDGLDPGSYREQVCLSTNDPDQPLIAVPVELTVVGDEPAVTVDPAALDFIVAQGDDGADVLSIGNVGSADLVWTLDEAGAARGDGGEQVADGGFEAGTPNPFWDEGSTHFDTPLCNSTCGGNGAYNGSWWAWFGGVPDADEFGFVAQQVTLPPAESAELRFWLFIDSAFAPGEFRAMLDGEVLFSVTEADAADYATYTEVVLDVTHHADGEPRELRFEGQTEGQPGVITNFFLDEVSLTVAAVGCDSPVDIPWLSAAPDAGVTAPGDSTPVDVTVTAVTLDPGAYQAHLCAVSNDPHTPLVSVPVSLTVTEPGGSAELAFDPAGLDFGDVDVGVASAPQTALLRNLGEVGITGLDFDAPGAGFEVDASGCGDALPVDGECPVSVVFTPSDTGPFEATVTVASNEAPPASLALAGNGIEPGQAPVIEVDPDSLSATLEPGQTVVQPLAIANIGDGLLEWTVSEDNGQFERVGAIELAEHENAIFTATIDPSGRYGLFASNNLPGRAAKVDLATFERVAGFVLPVEESQLRSIVVDPAGEFAYFGTGQAPGRVVKVDLESFTRVDAIALETGENALRSAVIDPEGRFAYFGTGTPPGQVVKVDLENLERIGAITLADGEIFLDGAVIDDAGEFAYFITSTSPGRLVKIDLDTFERVDAVVLEDDERALTSVVMDPAGEYVYVGTGIDPLRVVKIDLATFQRTDALTIDGGQSQLRSAVVDPDGRYAYFGTGGNPASLAKIDLDTFEQVDLIVMEDGESVLASAVIDPSGGFAFFGTYNSPGKVVKVGLGGGCQLPDWLAVDPSAGEVAGGDSQAVEVTFDAAGLEPGQYQASVCIASNDAAQPVTTIPVTLSVEQGGEPPSSAKLVAGDGAAGDWFGRSVAIDGDTALVGADGADVDGVTNQGAAYVFVRDGEGWVEQAKLVADDGGSSDQFGMDVALSGDTAVVGRSGNGAYVFVRDGDNWIQQTMLTSSDMTPTDTFGSAVALHGDTLVVGARQAAVDGNNNQGAAYVFVRDGDDWVEQAKLVAGDGVAFDLFGDAVAISGDTVVAGAAFADPDGNDAQGAAYVFTRSGSTWTEQAKLVATDGATGHRFGVSVAVAGDDVAVGAHLADGNLGAAYVFSRSGSDWQQQARLAPSDTPSGALFGESVAIQGDVALVGALFADGQGAAYVFDREDGSWAERAKLVAPDAPANAQFGNAIALNDGTALIGAWQSDVDGVSNQGAAYVVEVGGTGPGPGGELEVTPSMIDFGELPVGETTEATVTVANGGDAALEVTALDDAQAPFERSGGDCPALPFGLGPDDSCTLVYRFAPTDVGSFEQTLTVTSDAGAADVSLLGIGIDDGEPVPQLAILGGDGQSATVGTGFAEPLAVQVRDAGNQPLPGVEVTFQAPSDGPGALLSASSVTTDDNGYAAVTATANQEAGSYPVGASIDGAEPVAFTLTNVAASADLEVTLLASRDHVRPGQRLDYVVAVHNLGPDAGQDVGVVSTLSSLLDLEVTSWQCLGPASSGCTAFGEGDLVDDGLSLPAQGSVLYALRSAVPAQGEEGLIESVVDIGAPGDPNPGNDSAQADTVMVLYRDGFQAYGDGAAALEPVAGRLTPHDGLVLTWPAPAPAPAALVETVLAGESDAGEGFRIERLQVGGGQWLRLVGVEVDGEFAGDWLPVTDGTELLLGLVEAGDDEPATVRITGAGIEFALAVDLREQGYRIRAALPVDGAMD